MDDPDVTFADAVTNRGEGDTFAALDEALHRLPPGQRRAFELLKIEGFSLKEASVITGTTIAALKVATHRAVVALRKALRGTATRT
jgi:RNA polymerase sigma-70 factor (ECF subfamily)